MRAQSLPSQPAAPCCSESGIAPREVDFPYYTLQDGYQSTLNLVSDSPHSIDLSIVLYSALGHTAIAPPFTIQPQQKLAIDLGNLLTQMDLSGSGEFGEGSIAVMFMGTIMPVVGQVTITNPAQRLIHEAEMVENDPGRSDIPAVLDGLWWGLGGGRDARIVVANMASQQVTADVYLDFGGSRHASAPLMFAPHELKTLSVTQLLTALGTSPAQAPAGGITIIGHDTVPSLIAQGKITDSATGFSSTIDFPDPAFQIASALHASGLPIGTPPKDSPFAGAGTFIPQVVVRNLLSSPQAMTITVEYPQPSGANGAASSTGPAGLDPVAAQDGTHSPPVGHYVMAGLRVPGYATEDFSLSSVMGELPAPLPFCSIRIQYSGAPGSMEAAVSSVEQSQDLVVDAKPENEGNGWAGSGANPWHLDKNTESILFLTNESDKAARIGFSITANGVHYYLNDLRLQPHETRAIDIRALRDAQLADFRKSKIPADAADGSVNWVRLDNVPVMGRLMVIS
ncbi:MAG: hypothetical protein ACRD2O_18090, partial [Terriglobia bacterium]